MLGVLSGFSVIWTVILGGYVLGRSQILGEHGSAILSRLVFYVGTPCLLLVTLSQTDLSHAFSGALVVSAASGILAALLFIGCARFVFHRPLPESLTGAMSASVVNAANLGIPIAVYVLGDAVYVAPVLIFQMVFFEPLYLILLDTFSPGRSITKSGVGVTIAKNPVLIASLLGILITSTGMFAPPLLMEPLKLVAGLAVPGALLAFGMSLSHSKPFQHRDRHREVGLAVTIKLLIHPCIAFGIGYFMLGVKGHALFAVVVAAALPTAQNVFIFASRYKRDVAVASEAIVATTAIAVLTLVIVAALFA